MKQLIGGQWVDLPQLEDGTYPVVPSPFDFDMLDAEQMLRQQAITKIICALGDVTQGCIDPDVAEKIAVKAVNKAFKRMDPK